MYIVTLAYSNGVARDFLLVMPGNGVMTKIGDTALKPRASGGCTHMVALLDMRLYHG